MNIPEKSRQRGRDCAAHGLCRGARNTGVGSEEHLVRKHRLRLMWRLPVSQMERSVDRDTEGNQAKDLLVRTF